MCFIYLIAASLHIEYPMLFKVENSATGRFTHCGVLEFVADEGMVYLPHWVSVPHYPHVDEVLPRP